MPPKKENRPKLTGEAQFLHDTFNGSSIKGDALIAARKILEEVGKEDKSDRWDMQAFLTHLDRLQNVITKARKRGKPERADKFVDSLIESVCSPESGFITQSLSSRAKELELARAQRQENLDAIAEGRSPKVFSMNSISEEHWEAYLKTIQNNQKSRLSSWIKYLSEDESIYPTWFKFYAVRSILSLKNRTEHTMNEEGHPIDHHYKKRDRDTLDSFPELNREALAKTFSELASTLSTHKKYSTMPGQLAKSDDTKTELEPEPSSESKMKFEASFSKLYAKQMNELGEIQDVERQNMEGEWVVYHEGQGLELSASLEGFGTGWCIGDEGTSKAYLEYGEIHIYYSQLPNDPNARRVPRLCIRYRGQNIDEVRGIETAQAVESVALPTLEDKLNTLSNGKGYLKRANFQKFITSAIEKHNSNQPLTKEEIKAIWGIGYSEEEQNGFGYGVNQAEIAGENSLLTDLVLLREYRDRHDDLAYIFSDKGELTEDYVALEEQILDRAFDVSMLQTSKIPHSYIANRLIDAGYGGAVAHYLDKFQGLDHDYIANRLIDAGYGWSVVRFLDKFQGLDHNVIATRLIDAGYGNDVADSLYKFHGLDHNVIANRLIDAGNVDAVVNSLYKFHGLDHNVIANRLIDAGKGRIVAECLYRFQGLDHNVIANRLIDAGNVDAVAWNLEKFQGLNQDIANRLIDAGKFVAVAWNLEKFQGLNQDIANRLIDAGYGYDVERHLDKFQNLDIQRTLSR